MIYAFIRWVQLTQSNTFMIYTNYTNFNGFDDEICAIFYNNDNNTIKHCREEISKRFHFMCVRTISVFTALTL